VFAYQLNSLTAIGFFAPLRAWRLGVRKSFIRVYRRSSVSHLVDVAIDQGGCFECSLEYALSRLFSPKQKELFKKKLEGLPLTKSEKEYYSRTVKKKVVALANDELHSLSKKLLGL